MSKPSQHALEVARTLYHGLHLSTGPLDEGDTLEAYQRRQIEARARVVDAAILAAVHHAFAVLEADRKSLGDTGEPTGAQELLDYLEGKPGARPDDDGMARQADHLYTFLSVGQSIANETIIDVLDGMVHDEQIANASEVNNQGPCAQIEG